MRLLFDNRVPYRFAAKIVGHDVRHVLDLNWDQLKDGPLLAAIGAWFDVLITVDRSMQFQQSISSLSFFVIILRARRTRLADLVPVVPQLLAQLAIGKLGLFYEVE